MSFQVDWKPAALNQLADIWNNAHDRKAVTAAANALDGRAGAQPTKCRRIALRCDTDRL